MNTAACFIDDHTVIAGPGTILTSNGKLFDLVYPRASDLDIEVIAHGLAKKDRASGFYNRVWSVAEHSILTAYIGKYYAEQAGIPLLGQYKVYKRCLLHDASEAYLIDMPRPLKYMPQMAWFREIEKNLQQLIDLEFRVSDIRYDLVKQADDEALQFEFFHWMKGARVLPWVAGWDKKPVVDMYVPIAVLTHKNWEESKALFLQQYSWVCKRIKDLES